MKRRIFTILSALSLLMFVAVVVLWVRSYWTHHLIIRVVQENQWHVSSVRGKLWLFVHESKDEWTGNWYALLSGPPGGRKSPSRGGRRPEGSERYFRLNRYPVATLDQERRTAWDDPADSPTIDVRGRRFWPRVQEEARQPLGRAGIPEHNAGGDAGVGPVAGRRRAHEGQVTLGLPVARR